MKFPILFICVGALALSSCQTAKSLIGATPPAVNEGVCPQALVLWDAARKVQIGEPQTYANIGFTAEILSVRSLCTYVGTNPIDATLEIDFAFGRGPAAVGMEADFSYFVSVTRKNRAIITKETYPLPIKFRQPDQIVRHTEKFASILIPRLQQNTSGNNFEIIVGFELNENELEFARSGKRFRVNAGSNNR
ncbi:MAG: hypothetical protein JKX99_04085 [Robiginitomaculum sp.]|nr:hypothetical protein [Robiginitomaculum sp.]